MLRNHPKLNIVRIGADMTFSTLNAIGNHILDSFEGLIREFDLSHYDTPYVDSIDAYLLTMVLYETFGGHLLGITDADLTTPEKDEFYRSIFGGKNPQNDVAVVSTRNLAPREIQSDKAYNLYVKRVLKVALHEVGHNFGLTDHASYRTTSDGTLCPMSRGEINKFGYRGYVQAIIDGRGMNFCDECTGFLRARRRILRTSHDISSKSNPA
jgi:Peptidase family M54